MHGMVSAKRQARDDSFRSIFRHERAGGEQIAHDSVIDLRIDRSLVYGNTCATGSVCLYGFTKALDHVGLSRAGFVLQGYKKSPLMRFIEVVVVPRPGIDVHHSAGRDSDVASVTNAVGKHRGAKTSG